MDPELDTNTGPAPDPTLEPTDALDTQAPEPTPPANEPPADDAQAAPKTAADAVKAALEAGKAAAEPAPPATEPAAPAKPAAPAPAAAPDDAKRDALYQIPQGVSREARARFVALAEHARGLETKATEIQQQHQQATERLTQYQSVIEDAGATPEVLAAHLGYIKAITSGDLTSAMEFIENERKALAVAIGKPVEGVDLLADFPDLKQRVDEMNLSQDDAIEIANARRAHEQQQHRAQQAQATAEQQQQVAQIQAQRTAALNDINAWVTEMKAKVIDFGPFEQAIIEYLQTPVTRQLLANTPAHLWKDVVVAQYDLLRRQESTYGPPPNNVQPMRPRGAGGNAAPEAATAIDAVKQALNLR